VPGADGTQVLKTQDSCFPLFGKYLLEALELPDLGYSRHFKWVKEKSFFLPSLEHQKRIAKSLFSIDKEISLLKDKTKMLIKQKKGLSQRLFKGQNIIKDI
jgi:type I restriction enzyme S subunit